MKQFVIACDLGTGGNKASIYEPDGNSVAEFGCSYPTFHPEPQYHEQRPQDWWQAIVASIRGLISQTRIDVSQVEAISLSGHSLGCVPIDLAGNLLLESVPIWSDSRATAEVIDFFQEVNEHDWYLKTGNGFPPPLYTVFKVLWLKQNRPETFARCFKILGTKDYINYRLTGKIATDFSYASGSGIYDLVDWDYDPELLRAGGLDRSLFADIVSSTDILGGLTSQAAESLGLPRSVKVVAGGVDNSCMALGAGNINEGDVYNSLGSSSWIAVTSAKPLLDVQVRPFVFTHVLQGMFNSATSIFSSGTSLEWVRTQLCRSAMAKGADEQPQELTYEKIMWLAEQVPPGANRLFFVPTLAGGTYLEGGPDVRGALVGIDLSHTQADIMRATLEGIAFGLRVALDELRRMTKVSDKMMIFGGGAKSRLWRQIYADIYNCAVVKSRIDQQTAALGAAALAAVGTGMWPNFSRIKELHAIQEVSSPIPANVAVYEAQLPIFKLAAQQQSELGSIIRRLKNYDA